MSFLSKLFGAAKGELGKGSAFTKLALQDAELLAAQGKVSALNAAHKAKAAVIDDLETIINAVHVESDKITSRLAEQVARL